MKRLWILLVAVTAVGLSAAGARAANPHFIGDPTCTLSSIGNGCQVCCSGSIAGLGTTPTQVGVDVAGGCATRPGSNEPAGHVQATTAPITPRGGRINFGGPGALVCATVSCPGGLDPVFGDEATIFVVPQGGVRQDVGVETIIGTCP